MHIRESLLLLKGKPLAGILLLTFVSIMCVAFTLAGNDDFDFARREILLRRIGHEILLQSGDSVSRVLPVKKIAKDEYQISFENAFTFRPDSLVNITQRLLGKDPLANDYVVNVVSCANAGITYGYAIARNKKDDIVACIGRTQPKDCYRINIKFRPAGIVTTRNGYLLASLAGLAFVGFFLLKFIRTQKAPAVSQGSGIITLGSVAFDADGGKLTINGNTAELTRTETRILRIFALFPNQVVERSRLQKEIWEDEGVIVGRSLDMFISKIRKKLEPDPSIRIVVVRGKGYKLEVGSSTI